MPNVSQELLPSQQSVSMGVLHAAVWLRIALESIGGAVIAVGAVVTVARLVRASVDRHVSFNDVRLAFAGYLAMALEFQLAADILDTAITPSWPSLQLLAAVAVIRTALNYFLSREMREEREQSASRASPPSPVARASAA